MRAEDGEWIRDEAASPAGASGHGSRPAGAGEEQREDGWPDEDGPDDEWPTEGGPNDEWPAEGGPDDEWPGDDRPPGLPSETGKRWGRGGVPGFSVWMAAAVAVLAAAAGVGAGLLIKGTPTASAAGAATPSATAPGGTAPGGSGASMPALPGPAENGNGQVQIILTGRVQAVSATSITIGGSGPSVTAAVTSATKVTGAVRGIAGVKAGDRVAAQVSGTPGHLVATAIQDPVQ
jgi:hypothetical protein